MSSTRNIMKATGLLAVASAGLTYGTKKFVDKHDQSFKQMSKNEQATWLAHLPQGTSVDVFSVIVRHQQMVEARAKVEEELAQEKESVSNRM